MPTLAWRAPQPARAPAAPRCRTPSPEDRPSRRACAAATSSPASTASAVSEPSDVAQAIADNDPGDQVAITVQRDGSSVTVRATLGTRPGVDHPMSFAAPLFLLGLLALPVLAVLYAREQQRRRAAAAAFATPALQPSVAPRRPGWRRHAPLAAVALALALLVAAAAKPQRTVAVPVERAAVVLATDVSGSMTATDIRPSRLAAAKRAAGRFVDEVPDRVNVGVLAFNDTPQLLQSPTRDREAVKAAIDGMAAERRHGDRRSDRDGDHHAAARAIAAPGPRAAILLLSDGKSTQRPRRDRRGSGSQAPEGPRLHGRARNRARARSKSRGPPEAPRRAPFPPTATRSRRSHASRAARLTRHRPRPA